MQNLALCLDGDLHSMIVNELALLISFALLCIFLTPSFPTPLETYSLEVLPSTRKTKYAQRLQKQVLGTQKSLPEINRIETKISSSIEFSVGSRVIDPFR